MAGRNPTVLKFVALACQMKEQVLKRDGENRTLLQLAVISRSKDIVDAVVSACQQSSLTEPEVTAS